MTKYTGKMLTEAEYHAGKALFQKLMANGRPRCQSYSRVKIKSMKEAPAYPYEDLSVWAEAQCRNPVAEGYQVCGRHGAGFASRGKRGGRPPIHGRYSKVLGDLALRRRYEEALADEGLFEMREEMALLGARTADLLARWGDNPPDMEELVDVVQTLGQALQVSDIGAAQEDYVRLTDIVTAGKGQWAVWGEVCKLIEQRRKLTITELGRLEKLQQFLTAQQAMAFLASIVDILNRAQLPIEVRHDVANQFRILAGKQLPSPPMITEIVEGEYSED